MGKKNMAKSGRLWYYTFATLKNFFFWHKEGKFESLHSDFAEPVMTLEKRGDCKGMDG
jgi:hypothetical protein